MHRIFAKYVGRTVNLTNGHYKEEKPNRTFAVQFYFGFALLVLFRGSKLSNVK